jgi:hypothetical protein
MKLGTILGICVLSSVVGVACGSSNSDDSFDGGGSGGSSGKGSSGSGSSKGGTQSSGGESSGGDGSGEAGATASGGSGATDSGGSGGSETGEAGSANAGASVGGAANCPDVFADYDIVETDGMCGDLDDQVTQSLEGTTANCFLHFVSEGALNSGADLDENGDFEGATLYVGSAQRSPCSGDYEPSDGSLVVTCGGAGDACTVTLEPQ